LFGHDQEVLRRLIEKVKAKVKKPVLVKLSPNTGDVKGFAKVCIEAGADGLVLINTLLGMKINVRDQKPELFTRMGGLSGPAILPIAVRMVWEVFDELGLSVPIIGVGGIYDTDSALQHILAGASSIQVGTANFFDPYAPLKILDGIEEYMHERSIERFVDLVGKAHQLCKLQTTPLKGLQRSKV
ncbi:MAG: dihydroorotate dehydrogenase, partial [Aquificaceae bacterium]